MWNFLNSKKAYWTSMVIGLLGYFVISNIRYEARTGVCLFIEQSGRSLYRSAWVGIEEKGIHKTVMVYLDKENNLQPGEKLLVRRVPFEYKFENEIDTDKETKYFLLFGQVNKLKLGIEWPLDQICEVRLNGGPKDSSFTVEGRYYFMWLEKGKEQVVTFSTPDFVEKKLTVFKSMDTTEFVFSANCLFKNGSGSESINMNLDSIIHETSE